MISYHPLWDTMKKKNITKYQLINHYGFSSNTIRRIQHDEPMNTTTINKLCLILGCSINDIISFTPTENELHQLESEKKRIEESKRIKFTL